MVRRTILTSYVDYNDKIYQLACELYNIKHSKRRKKTLNEWEYYLSKQVEYAEMVFEYNYYMYTSLKPGDSYSDCRKDYKFMTEAAKNMLLDYRDQYLDFIEKYKDKE